MAVGIVKWFNTTKGYGFIRPEDGSADVFVHVTAVQRAGLRSLMEGERVSFEVVRDRGKLAAANLTRRFVAGRPAASGESSRAACGAAAAPTEMTRTRRG